MRSARSLTRCLATTVALTTMVTALVGAGSGPAAADDTHRDAVRDVLSAPRESDALPQRHEPKRTLGDITRTTVAFAEDLVVTTRFRGLDATGFQQFTWSILTSQYAAKREPWSASLYVQPHRNRGVFTLIDPVANQPQCGAAKVGRAARTVTLTISADCLDHPEWVRVGNGVTFTDGGRVYLDDARRDGGVRRSWQLGPEVAPASG